MPVRESDTPSLREVVIGLMFYVLYMGGSALGAYGLVFGPFFYALVGWVICALGVRLYILAVRELSPWLSRPTRRFERARDGIPILMAAAGVGIVLWGLFGVNERQITPLGIRGEDPDDFVFLGLMAVHFGAVLLAVRVYHRMESR